MTQSSIPKFYEEGFIEEKLKKVIYYLQNRWPLKIAMSQCGIPRSKKSDLIKSLDKLGINYYRK